MPLTVGLIGCGFIGRFHARNLKAIEQRGQLDIRYDAVCDRNIERAEAFAELGGCSLITTNPADVIAHCDAVYVCTETSEHPELAYAAAEAGRHLFCEKPLGRNLPEARAMTEAVRGAGIVHQVGLVLHHSPVYSVLAELLTADTGPVLTAHLRDDQCFPVRGQYASAWRGDVSKAGGGTLLEHSIHDVDLLSRLFGPVTSVRCHTRNVTGYSGIEDVALVTFQHEGGHQTTLSSTWHSIDSRSSSRHLEVFCQRGRFETYQDYFGTISCELDADELVILSSDEVLNRFMAAQGLHSREEDLRSLGGLSDRRFLEAVLAGRPAKPSFDDALVAHEIVDACYRSAAEGRDVAVTT